MRCLNQSLGPIWRYRKLGSDLFLASWVFSIYLGQRVPSPVLLTMASKPTEAFAPYDR
jgi:hypothetical protein